MQENNTNLRYYIGIAQGFILYFLYISIQYKFQFAVNSLLFVPICTIVIFLPLLLQHGLNNLRIKTLILWSISATILLSGLGYYDAWCSITPITSNITPSISLIWTLAFALFILQSLIEGSDKDKKFVANYTTYFDVSWKLIIQLTLTVFFVSIFWSILFLTAALFTSIKIDFIKTIISYPWFYIPTTTVAFCTGLHITDVNATLVTGVRKVILTLFSYLLPVLVFFLVIFFASLPIKAVSADLKIQNSESILFFVSIWMVLLVNCAYQYGENLNSFFKLAIKIGGVLLLPAILLSTYGLCLITENKGFSYGSVYQFILSAVLIFYGIGYLFIAFKIHFIKTWNLYAAYFIAAVLLLTLTPALDPAKIVADSQIKQIQANQTNPEEFRFRILLNDGERYGYNALLNFAQNSKTEKIAQQANLTLSEKKNRYKKIRNKKNNTLIINTESGKLPKSFKDHFKKYNAEICPRFNNEPCSAWVKNIDDKMTVLIFKGNSMVAFQEEKTGVWKNTGSFTIPHNCPNSKKLLVDSKFKFIAPKPYPFPDLEINGTRFKFSPFRIYQECD